MTRNLDIVLYGATGITGKFILEQFFKSAYADRFRIGIAGRNEQKLRKVLGDVGQFVDRDLTSLPVIIADHSNTDTLAEMAKQARVIINVVGQYSLHGESVVKAAVENGASHLDLSGEPAWLEEMQLKYSAKARETGAYIIGATGWISMPTDMGVSYLKSVFPGCLAYSETFTTLNQPSGYASSSGIFKSILLAMAKQGNLEEIRRQTMPEKLETYPAPKRPPIWYNQELQSYVTPFLVADATIVNRSEYHKAVHDKSAKSPMSIETYVLQPSFLSSLGNLVHFGFLYLLCQFGPTYRFCQRNPELTSLGLYNDKGPTREQVKQATFTTYIQGHGWKDTTIPQLNEKPTEKLMIRVDGPDAQYLGTSGFVLSAAATILEDKLPVDGGVYTTAIAFEGTKIFDRLRQFGITFRVQ
ncbi:Sacchrp-dh-NADP domain-containing protein [Aphelenchoides bicaudatus]|nr:Sacchrp-dh-NADP domain-containing protein [Aphelenchoides bicaudatus]